MLAVLVDDVRNLHVGGGVDCGCWLMMLGIYVLAVVLAVNVRNLRVGSSVDC